MTETERTAGGEKHAAAHAPGGGLLGIRSLVRRRPTSVPRGGGAVVHAAAPRQRSGQQQQMQQRGTTTTSTSMRRINGGGGGNGGGIKDGHSTASFANVRPLQQRRMPSSSQVHSQSHEHLRRAPRPRTRPLSQPRGVLGTSSGTHAGAGPSTTGGARSSSSGQQRLAQRPRHGSPPSSAATTGITSSSEAARSGRSLVGAGVGRSIRGTSISGHASHQRRAQASHQPKPHDTATLQRMREESRRRMGFDTAKGVVQSRRSAAPATTAGGRNNVRRRHARPLLKKQQQQQQQQHQPTAGGGHFQVPPQSTPSSRDEVAPVAPR